LKKVQLKVKICELLLKF